MSRVSLRAGLLMLLVAPAWARAQEPAAAPVAVEDRRVQELLARQQRLEAELRTQGTLLRALTVKADEARASDAGAAAPLAGYADKNVFLRDRNDWFVLLPKGRVQIDWYNFLNRPPNQPGIVLSSDKDPRASLRDTLFIRRARLGLAGTALRHIDFRFEAEFASLATPGQFATITDGYLVLNWTPYFKVQAGQFFAPFTLENPTSTNYVDFMERSAAVRFAVPSPREIGGMIFGELPRKSARYYFGVFNGDGQNFKDQDNRPAVIGRLVFAPLALWRGRPSWLEDLWVGGSYWWKSENNLGGSSAPSTTGAAQNDLASVTTQGGFSIFNSSYGNGSDAMKNAVRSHLAPNGNTIKYAFELNLPVWKRWGVRAEYVHVAIDLKQYNDVNPGNGNLTRTPGAFGHLDGFGAYVEAFAWIYGEVNVDRPGYYEPSHWGGYRAPRASSWAVMLAAKYEHVEFDVTNLPSTVNAIGARVPDPATGHYGLDAFELGANLWFTRHARASVNYVLNYIGAGDPSQSAVNEQKNLFFQQSEHELLFRLQASL